MVFIKNVCIILLLFLFNCGTGFVRLDQFELTDIAGQKYPFVSVATKPFLVILVEKIHCFECIKQLLSELRQHSTVETFNVYIVYQTDKSVLNRKFFVKRLKKYIFSSVQFVFSDINLKNDIFAYFQVKGSPSVVLFNKDDLKFNSYYSYNKLFDERGVLRPKIIDSVLSVLSLIR